MKRSFFLLVLMAAVIGSLIYSRHAPTGYFNFYSELRADMAGYYVYLPALFIYDFKGEKLPDDIEDKVAHGFRVDSVSQKIHTKYPSGVAIMQAPFFILTHAFQNLSGGITDGFSGAYHNVPNWASWVYSSLGLWWFFLFMRRRIGVRGALVLALMLYFGTNVLHYSIEATGMSHIYSFSLFAGFLLLAQRQLEKALGWPHGLLLGLVAGLIIAVRPLNALFVFIALLFFLLEDLPAFLRSLKPRFVLAAIVGGFLAIFPQLLYWHYLSGDWVYYSYGNESFANILHPDMMAFWFAPNNGLFLYNPVYWVAVLSMLFYIRLNLGKGLLILISFFGLSYILASWHSPYFGCSYGSRNFVEYSCLFFIPLGEVLLNSGIKAYWRTTLLAITGLAVIFNLKMIYNYNVCFFSDTWDWEEFRRIALRGFYHEQSNPGVISPEQEYGAGMEFKAGNYTISPFYMVDVSAEVEFYSLGEETLIALQVMHNDSVVAWRGTNIRQRLEELEHDRQFYTRFFLPKEYNRNATYRLYVYNLGRDSLKVEDLQVWMR